MRWRRLLKALPEYNRLSTLQAMLMDNVDEPFDITDAIETIKLTIIMEKAAE